MNGDILGEIQERQWQAYCAAEHAKAEELFGPFVAWCIWPYRLSNLREELPACR